MSDSEILYGATTILPDGTKVTFQMRSRRYPRWVSGGRGRGYMSPTHAEYRIKPRMYVSCPGESVLDNLMNRTTRPYNVWGKLIRQAMKQLELDGKIGWYAKAGCSCPCSPGFIWSNAPQFDTGNGYGTTTYDVSVWIEGVPLKRDDAEAQLEQLHRGAQLAADPTMPMDLLASATI